jgi:hypothetical protein
VPPGIPLAVVLPRSLVRRVLAYRSHRRAGRQWQSRLSNVIRDVNLLALGYPIVDSRYYIRFSALRKESECGGREVIAVLLKNDPFPPLGLRNLPCSVRPGKDIQYQIASLRKQTYEVLWQLRRKPGRVRRRPDELASVQVLSVALRVRDLQQVRRDRATIILCKTSAYVMPGRTGFGV